MGTFGKFLKSTKIISRILFLAWLFFVFVWFKAGVFSASAIGEAAAFLMYPGMLFLIPLGLIEYKKNPVVQEARERKGAVTPPLGHTICGVILMELSGFFLMTGLVSLSAVSGAFGMSLLILFIGICLFSWGVLLVNGHIAKTKLEKKQAKAQPKQRVETVQTVQDESEEEQEQEEDISCTDSMDAHDFSYYCANLLEANGFKNVIVLSGIRDHGADILAEKDGAKYAVQCRLGQMISNAVLQEVNAAKIYYNCENSLVMTNVVSETAKERSEASNVTVWDRADMQRLLKNVR